MKVTDSQIDYIKKRGKSYDHKYGMLSDMMTAFLHPSKQVIELFGGIGITSYFIEQNLTPRIHVINEIDDRCIKALEELKKDTGLLKNTIIRKEDSFFTEIKDYDIVFADSNFTKKMFDKFDNIFRNVKDTLVLTETGIFNLKFNKNSTVENYYQNYQELFKKYGLYLHVVLYTHSFSIMLLKKTPIDTFVLTKYTDENKEWREYVKCINIP